MLDPIRKGYNMVKSAIGMGSTTPPAGSVTKTVKQVSVTPPQKRRGGSINR